MKKLLLILVSVFSLTYAHGQMVNDSVTVGAGYVNQSYYSLANGEVSNISQTDWDMAFDVSGFGASIRINGSQGIELYLYPNGDSSAYNGTIDTSTMASWPQLYDSDTSWSLGAFNQNADVNDAFDLGWGSYNLATHHVDGDSLFVIKLASGALKKLHIMKLAGGEFTFRHADLDGSNAVDASITKTTYPNKNFVYYDIANNTVIDREPLNTAWDFVFTKYLTELAPSLWYGVTGALNNGGVTVAEATPVASPSTYTNYSAHTFEHEINSIGYDWKSFNGTTFSYDIVDSLAYFVNDVNGNIWRLVFTDFLGTSSGDIYFSKELLAAVNTDAEAAIEAFQIYPNPATNGEVSLLYTLREQEGQLTIYDLNGVEVVSRELKGSGFHHDRQSLSGIAAGVYIVMVRAGESSMHQKLIVR